MIKGRILFIIFLCLSVLAFYTGCSRLSDKSSDGVIRLEVWETYKEEHDLFIKLVKEFEEKYSAANQGKKIEIKINRVPFDNIVENIKTACMINRTPDIGRLDSGKILELAYHKVLKPIDKLKNFECKTIEEKGKAFLPGPFQTNIIRVKDTDGQWREHLYGLPEQGTCVALFWNRGLFKERAKELKAAGLDPERAPRDLDEAIEYAKILTIPEKKQYGFAFDNNLWFTFPFFYLYNADFVGIDANGKYFCAINSKQGIAALQKKMDICNKTYQLPSGVQANIEAGSWRGGIGPDQGFTNEKFAMILMGAWYLKTFESTVKDFSVAVIPKISKRDAISCGLLEPNANDEEYNKKITTATNLGGNNFVIFNSCKNPEIAYEFISFILSKETQLRWAKELKQIPVNLEAFEEYKKNPELSEKERAFVEQIYYSRPSPKIPLSNKLYEVANIEIEQALKSGQTSKEALDKIAKKLDKEIFSMMNE